MAPPDRDDHPRREDTLTTLAALRIDEASHSRMAHNAGRLASWVEWLLHPEEHEYDRTVIHNDGTRQEVSKPVTRANPTPGEFEPIELDFESVIARFDLDQFLDGMAAFATQEVERPDGHLSFAAAAVKNVWWLGDARMLQLVHEFPDESVWNGTAADAARAFIGDMAIAVTQLNKITSELADMVPRYALIIKGARDNLDRAAADAVAAFEKKFNEKPPGAWSKTFDEAARVLFTAKETRGTVQGFWWIDLAKTYMRAQADILADAISSLENLAGDFEGLISRFDKDVEPILRQYAP